MIFQEARQLRIALNEGEKRYDIHNQLSNRLSMIASAYMFVCVVRANQPILAISQYSG